jgi:hypothetical protein
MLAYYKIIFLGLALFTAAVPVSLAQPYGNGQYVAHKHLGRERILNAALAASVGLASIPAEAMVAYIQAIDGEVYFRDDGLAATSVTSRVLPSGASLGYAGKLSNLRFLSRSGTPALEVVYYGREK